MPAGGRRRESHVREVAQPFRLAGTLPGAEEDMVILYQRVDRRRDPAPVALAGLEDHVVTSCQSGKRCDHDAFHGSPPSLMESLRVYPRAARPKPYTSAGTSSPC